MKYLHLLKCHNSNFLLCMCVLNLRFMEVSWVCSMYKESLSGLRKEEHHSLMFFQWCVANMKYFRVANTNMLKRLVLVNGFPGSQIGQCSFTHYFLQKFNTTQGVTDCFLTHFFFSKFSMNYFKSVKNSKLSHLPTCILLWIILWDFP